MVKINGAAFSLDGKTVEEFLLTSDYEKNRVAIELNGNILPKSKYNETVLSDGDNLEIVSFVGGG